MSSDFEYIYEFYRDRGLSDEVGYVLSVGRPMGKLILHLEIPNDPESIIFLESDEEFEYDEECYICEKSLFSEDVPCELEVEWTELRKIEEDGNKVIYEKEKCKIFLRWEEGCIQIDVSDNLFWE